MINQNNYHIFLIALIPYTIICITLAAIGRSRGQSFILVLFVSFFTGWVFGIFLVLAAKGKKIAASSIIGILLCLLLAGCGEDNNPINGGNNPGSEPIYSLDSLVLVLPPHMSTGAQALTVLPICQNLKITYWASANFNDTAGIYFWQILGDTSGPPVVIDTLKSFSLSPVMKTIFVNSTISSIKSLDINLSGTNTRNETIWARIDSLKVFKN